MTLVGTDSFDMYNGTQVNIGLQSVWTYAQNLNGNIGNASLVAGRFGGQCIQLTNLGVGVQIYGFKRNLTAARTTGGVGIAHRQTNLAQLTNTTQPQIQLLTAGNSQVGLCINSDGSISIMRPGGFLAVGGGTVIATSPAGVILNNTWQYIGMGYTISPSVGAVSVYVDGLVVPSLVVSGVNTAASGGTTANQFGLTTSYVNSGGATLFDDFSDEDSATLTGPMRVDVLRPIADSVVQMTPSSGTNNFSRVNETLVDGDTSYVQDGTVGHGDLYSFGPLPITPTAIYGVQPVSFAEKTDAGTRTLYNQIMSSAVLNQGVQFNLPVAYSRFQRMLPVDPNTSLPWTVGAVNAILGGPAVAA